MNMKNIVLGIAVLAMVTAVANAGNVSPGISATTTTLQTPDTTPPAEVTNLQAAEIGTTHINWTWVNPPDVDFNNTIVNVTSGASVIVPDTKISGIPSGSGFFLKTGLTPNTEYTITVKTEDNAP